MDFDIDTLGYFLYMEEQEKEQQEPEQEYNYFRFDNEDNEVFLWQK